MYFKKRSICAKVRVTRVYVVWFYFISPNDYQIVHNLPSIHMFDYFLGVEQIVRVSMDKADINNKIESNGK